MLEIGLCILCMQLCILGFTWKASSSIHHNTVVRMFSFSFEYYNTLINLFFRLQAQLWNRGGNASNSAIVLAQLGSCTSFMGTLAKHRLNE